MDNLISFARRFKGFLGFSALIFLGLIFLVNYLFSQGSFDQVLAGFGNLNSTQFLSVVYAALGLPFIIVLLLIILSYRSTSQENGQQPKSGLIYVIVHELEDQTKGIPDAEVRLMLPEPRSARTDLNGGTKFVFPSEVTNGTYYINASKAGYQSGKTQQVKITHGATVAIALKREVQQTINNTHLSSTKQAAKQSSNKGTDETSFQIKQSYRTSKALVGLAIDLSGSMAENIRNNTDGQLSRLESFRRSMDRLIKEAKNTIRESQSKSINTSIDIFVYGFGLRGLNVCDLLSLVRVSNNIISQQEIEELKQKYSQETQAKYESYKGLGGLASQYGLGSLVRDFERSARSSAEAQIRSKIMFEVKRRLEKELGRAGDTTLPVEDVAKLWNSSEESLSNAEELIYGNTPMNEAMNRVKERFETEISMRSKDTTFTLFILSDGEPTDGDPLPAAQALKEMGVTIVSCFVTNQDIADPRTLFSEPETYWRKDAQLMFNMASLIEENSDFTRFLLNKGWTIRPNAKLFVQLNHSDILEEFIGVVISPVSEPASNSILLRGE